ncbi:putative aldehyde oxidase Art an 7 [Rutidosis leptorrhynchoides]|uniref:putative aldehyde oxidase Art an 7 n=1 Tax=Rutidosis leptorrhynchoides TaxID=125765 RepID=UPI003A990279
MASIKLLLLLNLLLLFACAVISHDLKEIQGQCKDGKPFNCPEQKGPKSPDPSGKDGHIDPSSQEDVPSDPGADGAGDKPADGGGDTPPAGGGGDTPPGGGGDQPAGGGGDKPDCPNKNGGGGGGGGGDKPADGGGDKPADGGGDKPADGGGDKPADGGGDKPAGGGGDKPAGGGGDKPDGANDKPAKPIPAAPTGPPADKPWYDPPLYGSPPLNTDYKGEWVVQNPDVGVNAMQLQVLSNNKAVWFDTTNLGPSARELGPKGNCPPNPDNNNEPDCFAHAVQYDVESGEVVSAYVKTDPWCSSGHVLPTGDLLSTGGNRMGFKSVRLFALKDPEPKFVERENALGANRWYASNCVLEDGSAVIVGGRDSYSYDIVPPNFEFQPKVINFPFLQQTTEPAVGPGLPVENNLYPFLYLLPDGNVFIFTNDRAVSFNPKTGDIVKEYPALPGGSRNYPPSGQSALFPLRFNQGNAMPVPFEVIVCGGNKKDAFPNIDGRYTQNKVFTPALADCNRLKVLADNPVWEKEQDMPSPRTMGDLLLLPNAQMLLINGAKKGTSGWEDAEDPNLTPTVYMPENEMGKRFMELNPTNVPRMYHSSSAVLPDGKILVVGSNSHQFYTFDGLFPTELKAEKFSPHYFDPKLDNTRPAIKEDGTDKVLKYGQPFKVTVTVPSDTNVGFGEVIVTLLYPPFTTHGFSQNQRLLIAAEEKVENNVITALAPPSGKVAPPGYYMMFVSYLNVPSRGVWVHID